MRRVHSGVSRGSRRTGLRRMIAGVTALSIPFVGSFALLGNPALAANPVEDFTATPLKIDGGAPDAEVPMVPDSDYAIPPDAVFVSPAGNDQNPGTLTAPFKSITRAITRAKAGGAVVIREGTYREQVPGFAKKLTIQPYPREKVWMKGSLEVSNWVADGDRWRLDNWNYEFCRTCLPATAVNPAFPLSAWPDQVFLDGRPLTQVASVDAVAGNTFFVDYVANTIHIGVDPGGRLVEASAFSTALSGFTSARGSTIRGLGFAQYAPNATVQQNGMVRINTGGFTVENNVFAYSNHNGLALYDAEDTAIRNNTFLYNGASGIGGYRANRLTVDSNRIAYSNQDRLFVSYAVAGMKVTRIQGATISNNTIEGNGAKGFWCDVSCNNFSIVRNLVRGNAHHGLMVELSSNGIIGGNVVVDHPTFGIRLDGTNTTKIYNNTLVRNWTNFSLNDNPWNNTFGSEIALGITWITGNISVYNNIMSETNTIGNALVTARDRSDNPFKPASSLFAGLDFNAYYRADPTFPPALVEFQETYSTNANEVPPVRYPDLASFQAATGKEGNGISVDGGPNPFFVDEAAGNYRLRAGSPAIGAGVPLPFDVAAALGLPAGQPVDLGAPFVPAAGSRPGSISVSDAFLVEGDAPAQATFYISLSSAPAAPVTVNVATADSTASAGSDYTALPSTTLTWALNDALTKVVTVPVNGDLIKEGDERFVLNLSGPTNATLADTAATATVVDNESAFSVYVSEATVVEGNAGPSAATFTVSLSHAPQPGEVVTADVATVNSSAQDPTDFTALPLTRLTWNAGDPTTKTVDVEVNGDITSEPNESFFLKVFSTSGNATIADTQGLATILNDESLTPVAPKLTVSVSDAPVVVETEAASHFAIFNVSLSSAPVVPVSVNVVSTDATAKGGLDYTPLPVTSLVWNPGDPLTKEAKVVVRGDTVKEGRETFLLTLSNAANAVIADGAGVATVIDNDPPFTIYVTDAAVTEGSAGPTTVTFSVYLSHALRPGEVVTVNVATLNSSATTANGDYDALPPTTLTWNAGDPPAKTVKVTVNGDTTRERDDLFLVRLSSNSANSALGDYQGVGTIVNDD